MTTLYQHTFLHAIPHSRLSLYFYKVMQILHSELTTLLEGVFLLHRDDFGQVGAEPLRVQEVEITEKTAVIKVK